MLSDTSSPNAQFHDYGWGAGLWAIAWITAAAAIVMLVGAVALGRHAYAQHTAADSTRRSMSHTRANKWGTAAVDADRAAWYLTAWAVVSGVSGIGAYIVALGHLTRHASSGKVSTLIVVGLVAAAGIGYYAEYRSVTSFPYSRKRESIAVVGLFVTLTGGCALFDAWNRVAAKVPMPFTVLVGLLLVASVVIAIVLVAQMGAPLVWALVIAGTAPIWLTVVIVALIASFPSSPSSPGVLT